MARRTYRRALCALGVLLAMTLAIALPQLSWAENTSGGGSSQLADETSDTLASRSWTFNASQDGIPTLEGITGTFDDIEIDATNGKFNPREKDVQINAGTVLTIPIESNEQGATLTLELSGGTASFDASFVGADAEDAVVAGASGSITVSVPAGATAVQITFTDQAYLATMTLSYNEPEEDEPEETYPGVPEDVKALDTSWDFTSGDYTDTYESERGEVDGLLIDATDGKFAPRDRDVQVNSGTVIYVPVAKDDEGATLTIAGTLNGEVTVDGETLPTDGTVELDCDETAYVAISFGTDSDGNTVSSYLTSISIDYVSDISTYPGYPESVTAQDTTWNLATDVEGEEARPVVEQGSRADWQGIRIDATTGRFAARTGDNQDTQVNAGTVLYIPIAQSDDDVTLRLDGNNYNNLTITIDGDEASTGRDYTVDASKARYVKVVFSGEGSCYLTSISVDYASDSDVTYHVVTVGEGGQYQTINEALEAEESSLDDQLVLSIAPGDYHERVVVDMPGVIFQNADATGEQAVTIHESYYSSNNFDEDGNFMPQDNYDLGTSNCGTVTVSANGTGFTAVGITFQNDYNVVDHLSAGDQTPAVAFNSKADRINLQDCSFIGRQDTVYLEGAGNRVYMSDCYIEGTVDFIFGDADAYITESTIHMAAFAGRTSGYFTAANTKADNTGLVFTNCTLTADESLDEVYLGRPWQNLAYYSETYLDSDRHTIYKDVDTSKPNPDYDDVSSAVTFIGCTMPSNIADEHWSRWMGRTEDNGSISMQSITYEPTVRFSEIGCTYKGDEPDEKKLFLGGGGSFVAANDQDTINEAIANALASMNFGTWSPSTFERVNDADAWDEETNPGDSTDTDGATSSDGSTGQGSTGSSTSTDNGEAGGSSDNGSTGSNTQQTASDDESDADAATEDSTASEADSASANSASDLPATDDASSIFAVIAFVGVVLCVAGVAIKRS